MKVTTNAVHSRSAVCIAGNVSSEVPDWLGLSQSAAQDLEAQGLLWVHGKAQYDRVLVQSTVKRGETDGKRTVFTSAVETVKALKERSISTADLYFPESLSPSCINTWLNIAILANYSYSRLTDQTDVPPDIQSFNCITPNCAPIPQLDDTIHAAHAGLYARDLANSRGSDGSTQHILNEAIALYQSASHVLDIEVISGDNLHTKGLQLIHGVGKGAKEPPRLVTLSYTGDANNGSKRLAVVGKCLTFDTGGLNLKPTGYIEDMYMDKAGACAALGLLKWVISVRFPVNITVTLAIAENSIGPEAIKPGDVLTALNGKTVEVTNTDAEGRLALADALWHTQKGWKPDTVIDLATLTGACMVALGEHTAGVFGNADSLISTLVQCGDEVGEPLWRLPITDLYREQMRGETADLVNDGAEGRCGAGQAAAFLEEFIHKDVNWAHIDLAGPAALTKPHLHHPAGATGFGVQLLIRYLYSRRSL